MATFEIKMPKLGESITEGTIISWSVKTGDSINEDDVLFEVSTAKVSAEIPSPVAGKVLEILFQEDDTVAVGTTVAIIGLEGSEDDTDNDTAVHTDIPEKESIETPANDKNIPSATPVPKHRPPKKTKDGIHLSYFRWPTTLICRRMNWTGFQEPAIWGA